MVGRTVVESQSKCAGTIYDSSGGHVDMWCASLGWLVKDGDERHRFVVIVYDKERTGGEKNKNGNTGRNCACVSWFLSFTFAIITSST
jgi:hypothetical protein